MTSARARFVGPRHRRGTGLLALAALVPLAGCSLVGGGSAPDSASDAGAGGGGQVVLVTHDSFHLPRALVRDFERSSGYDLVVRSTGDAGALTTGLVLTAGDPTGDVSFGVDNTFASRAVSAGVFADLDVDLPAGAGDYALEGSGTGEAGSVLAPVDQGDVCVNVDRTWFAAHHQRPPRTWADLTDPAYRGLLVTPSALTSSPGLAFLLGTVAEFGDDWPDYWQRLVDNDVEVVDGWTDAYYGSFTQGGGKGTRPVVVSYDSSPAFTVPDGARRSTTAALLGTCVRQVEYAGVLAGAENPDGGRAVVEWLLSPEVQQALPESMYVYPVADGTPLPREWARYAVQPRAPYTVDPASVDAHRDAWLETWRDIVTG